MRMAHFQKYLEESLNNLDLEITSARISTEPNSTEYTTIKNWGVVCNTMRSLGV